ncbi:uncharacterized protein LOC126378491 [Pectinophora gossypiella]|uniref:uncharacterized protein LOC126378491 n=1 Tax=Pectinophora gossypiella TaxID=13191 RepID=UPI00214F2040|nr:uncharacterized protein LOC126378491 [Pectinophora gossypiella]
MTYKWGTEQTRFFIEEYGRQACLWDLKHADYKNREARNNAYKNIIQSMESKSIYMTENDVKNKIRSLRCTYFGVLAKVERSKILEEVQEYPYVPKLGWFDAMHFLRGVSDPNDIDDSVMSGPETSNDTEQNYTHNQLPPSFWNTPYKLKATRQPTPRLDPISKDHQKKPEENPGVLQSFGIQEDMYPQISVAEDDLRSSTETPQMTDIRKELRQIIGGDEKDEFDVFGQNVSLQLKQLPLEYALESQEMIMRMLKEQRVKCMRHCSVQQENQYPNLVKSELL